MGRWKNLENAEWTWEFMVNTHGHYAKADQGSVLLFQRAALVLLLGRITVNDLAVETITFNTSC